MKPERGNPNRSAVAVVGRVRHGLEIKTREDPRENPHTVIGLRDVFRPIPQAAISYQKVITSTRQMQRMDTGNPAGREFSCNCIEGSVPALSVDPHTSCREPVDGIKRKTLCLSIHRVAVTSGAPPLTAAFRQNSGPPNCRVRRPVVASTTIYT